MQKIKGQNTAYAMTLDDQDGRKGGEDQTSNFLIMQVSNDVEADVQFKLNRFRRLPNAAHTARRELFVERAICLSAKRTPSTRPHKHQSTRCGKLQTPLPFLSRSSRHYG